MTICLVGKEIFSWLGLQKSLRNHVESWENSAMRREIIKLLKMEKLAVFFIDRLEEEKTIISTFKLYDKPQKYHFRIECMATLVLLLMTLCIKNVFLPLNLSSRDLNQFFFQETFTLSKKNF